MVALIIIVIIVASYLIVGYFISAPIYTGPVSDHFTGKKFISPGGPTPKGLADVMRWLFTRNRGPWTNKPESPYGAPPPERVHQGLRLTFVNHSTFLMQVDGLNILTDPVWSERVSPFTSAGPRRMRRPGIRFQDLPPIDLVLLSHNHYDHLDIRTVSLLHKTFHPKYVVPLGVGAYLREYGIEHFIELDWWLSTPVGADTSIECVPAQHFSGRGMFDRDATLWCGYTLLRPGGNICFLGDTGYNQPMFKEIGAKCKPALALIPIGAYKPEWFMSPVHCTPEEAVRIHIDLGSAQSVATHFGTFPLGDDGEHEAEKDLRAALITHDVPEGKFLVLPEGHGKMFQI